MARGSECRKYLDTITKSFAIPMYKILEVTCLKSVLSSDFKKSLS